MTRPIIALLTLIAVAPLSAQTRPQPLPNTLDAAKVAARVEDVASPDAIIAALYDANATLVDRKHGADRFRSLFVPGAWMIPTRRTGAKAMITLQSVEEYIRLYGTGAPRRGYNEREVSRTSEAFGNIMQVFSTYASYRDSTDTHPIRGINSIQLFNDGTRWWVVNVLWDNERADNPIPPQYLKSGEGRP